jgi:hypothetical protein
MTAALPDLLSEPDAARRLGLSVEQLRRLRYRGAIGYRRLTGKKVAYTEHDLAEYVESTRCAPSTAPADTGSSTDRTETPTSSPGGTNSGAATVDARSAQATLKQRKAKLTPGTLKTSGGPTGKLEVVHGSRTK